MRESPPVDSVCVIVVLCGCAGVYSTPRLDALQQSAFYGYDLGDFVNTNDFSVLVLKFG